MSLDLILSHPRPHFRGETVYDPYTGTWSVNDRVCESKEYKLYPPAPLLSPPAYDGGC